MSRSFRDLLKFSAPLVISVALLSGCGSGGGGSADLDEGGSTPTPPPPVTVTDSFEFSAPAGYFVIGSPPVHARFTGGVAENNGAWVIPEGQTGVIDFGTPADTVKFTTQDSFAAAAAAASGVAQKPDPRAPSQAVTNQFAVAMYLRGLNGDWNVSPARKFAPDPNTDNVLVLTIRDLKKDEITGLDSQFKVADAGYLDATNCGKNDDSDTVIANGTPYAMVCRGGFGFDAILQIPEDGDYDFTFDVRDADNPLLTVAKDVPDDGGGGEVPKDSTEIKVYGIDTLDENAEVQLLTTLTDLATGSISLDEIKDRTGGSPRITRIEIKNLGTRGNIGIQDIQWTADARFALDPVQVDIVYRRQEAGSTTGTKVKIGNTNYDCTPNPDTEYACIVRDVPMYRYANGSMLVTNTDGSSETITFNAGLGSDFDETATLSQIVFAISGAPYARNGRPGDASTAALPSNSNEVILFYKREDGDYDGWGLHLFPIDPPGDSWTVYTGGAHPYEGIDPQWGAFFRIALPGAANPAYSNNPASINTFPAALGVVIHNDDSGTDIKDPNSDLVIHIGEQGNIVFVSSGNPNVGSVPPGSGATFFGINGAIAHWVNATTIATASAQNVTGEDEIPGLKAQLLYSPDGSMRAGVSGITGTYEAIDLARGAIPELPNQKYINEPGDYVGWTLPASVDLDKAKTLARGQLIVRVKYEDGTDFFGTQVQIPGALDALYADAAFDEPLGVTYSSGVPSLAVWAPTALADPGVSVNIYDAAGTKLETVPMTLEPGTGIWKVTGEADWDRKFYTISLRVYSYAVNAIVTNEVTDPYSVSLAMDSARSQFVNLDDANLKPTGWDSITLPPLDRPEDLTLYELHVRDFSIADLSVAEEHRGKFTAFDPEIVGNTTGLNHLQQLADAGLKAVHILPAFDIATIKENPADRVELDDPVEKLCEVNPAAADLCSASAGMTIRQAMADGVDQTGPDRPSTQQIADWLRAYDGFNWGYDPWHFGAPEGSYSTDANGPQRILEFRRMVKGLHELGLRTIMDVVYNHTNASGQNSKSVLDRVVPGYYHRRDPIGGNVLRDSCCDDTASEFRMMEKLMIDTGKMWVRDYKIAGFRFDLMGFHPLWVMQDFKTAVQNPELAAHASSVYIYGEGWTFGRVAGPDNDGNDVADGDFWFEQARQANLGGTGLGSFSDRIRDPVRGTNFGQSGADKIKSQGFISGLWYDPNALVTDLEVARNSLVKGTDNIRLWQAGGLASYQLVNSEGDTVPGSDIDYSKQDSGYTQDPEEAINYISKHDDESLWDISQYKHPTGTPLADRVRADSVGLSLVLLGQGIPFWQAGTEILRSKSMDRNSYDSGDWYNEVDWTLDTSKWNQGLPPAADNSGSYTQIRQVQADPSAVQDAAARQRAFDVFKEFLRIRYSSNLFRMPNQAEIDERLTFLNTGTTQVPGVIVMQMKGCTEANADFVPDAGGMVVVFNATDGARTLNLLGDEAGNWALHPIQANSVDPLVKAAKHDTSGFYVPARTTAVFRRTSQTSCEPFSVPLFVRGLGGDNADWAALPDRVFTFKGGTVYEAYVKDRVAGPDDAGFKIADEGYTDGTNCGVSGQSVVLGEPLTLTCRSPGNDNIGFDIPSAGNYLFRLDATDNKAPKLTVFKSPLPRTVYVRGLGAGSDWSALPERKLEKPAYSDVYQALINVGAGADEFGFKIADDDPPGGYNDGTNCGSTTALTIGQPLTLACQGPGNGNIEVTFPDSGTYSFSLDGTVSSAPQLTVEKPPFQVPDGAVPPYLFVRGLGAGSDWSASVENRLEYLGGGQYELYKSVALGPDEFGFKIANDNYADGTNCGSTTALTIGQPLTLACQGPGNDNIEVNFPSAGTYRFSLDATNPAAPQLTVTAP